MRQGYRKLDCGRNEIAIRIAFRGRMHDLALPQGIAYALAALIPLAVCICLGAGLYLTFRDDMLASLMRRQAQMQIAYEDRIAALRGQIDSLATRQMLNQDSFEGKVAELAVRQARLESRSALVAALVAKVEPVRGESAKADADAVRRAATASFGAPGRPAAPAAAKPAPEGFDLRRAYPEESAAPSEDLSENVEPPSPAERLRNLAENFEIIERRQIAALDGLRRPAAAHVERLRLAFAEAGLPVERLMRRGAAREKSGDTLAVGGPFEPVPAGSAFDQAYASARKSVAVVEELRRALPFAPLRQPLPGPLDVTSTFGVRTDPFLGRPALHAGIDLRAEMGDPIRATAAGRVTTARASGGYGNMVEIDHGAGLATRYGHMSRIDVEEGDWVEAGAIIGRIGSTGRSTGPHLHYEVRIDGAAVDPARYLKAGRLLNAGL